MHGPVPTVSVLIVPVIDEMTEYDLSKTIIPYLDHYLAFPLFSHLHETPLFPTDEVKYRGSICSRQGFDDPSTLSQHIYSGEKVHSGGLWRVLPWCGIL